MVIGRIMSRNSIFKELVQRTCWKPLVKLSIHPAYLGKNAFYSLSGQGGNFQYRRKTHKSGRHGNFFHELFLPLGVTLEQIPLINQNNAGPTMILCIAKHLGILLGNPFTCIDKDQGNVTAGQRAKCLKNGKFFQFIRCFTFPPDAGSVDEKVIILAVGEHGIN